MADRIVFVDACIIFCSENGDSDCENVLDPLYQAYAESHESDPREIGDGFKELEEFLHALPLDDSNAVFNLCCRLCPETI